MLFQILLKNLAQPVYARTADSVVELVDVAGRVMNVLILSAGAVFVGFAILAAYKFATSEGDPKGIQGAKQSLTYAVVGLCVVVGVFAINAIVVGIISPSGGASGNLSNPSGLFQMISEAIREIETFAGIQ
ncbi:MAG TPA: hypothetical protein PLT50_01905 [bacterium]|nr:hypothetical protein [bacterium]